MALFFSTFEMLPDEILLEFCQYLHGGDVLYSFFGLNSRLNRTISYYCQNVGLYGIYFSQFLDNFTKILPQIYSSIRTLVIFEIESSFYMSILKDFSLFCNLEILKLINWSSEKLILFLDILHDMKNFRKLLIESLDLTVSIKDRNLLEKIFSLNNNQLTSIDIDFDCDSFDLTINRECPMIFSNICELNIPLKTTNDLFQLIQMIPNVEKLHITLDDAWIVNQSIQQTFFYLTEFSIHNIHSISMFDNLKLIIKILPVIKKLSLVLTTNDFSMIDGQQILSLLPSQLEQFHYCILYEGDEDIENIDLKSLLLSWKPFQMAYSICKNDNCILLHTIPCQSYCLALTSSLSKHTSIEYKSQAYTKVNILYMHNIININDTFFALRHCRKISILGIFTNPLILEIPQDQKSIIRLPYLHQLEYLFIEGIPSDFESLEKIFLIAPNLNSLSIDIDYLLHLFNNYQSSTLFKLLRQYIIILVIHFKETIIKEFTIEHIHIIAKIFSQVNRLFIDLYQSNIIMECDKISLILNHIPKLKILNIKGQLSSNIHLNKDNLNQWFIEHIKGPFTHINQFKIDYKKEQLILWK